VPEVTRLLEESMKRVLLAVRPEKLIVPDEVRPVNPEVTPAAVMFPGVGVDCYCT